MPGSDRDREDLDTLRSVAREAGQLAIDYFERSDVRFWDKSKGHPVTEADLAVNALIRERLMAARPDYGWLSEETALDNDTRTASRVWIVDPIDGTRAFMRQEPYWCIGLGVLEQGQPRAAVVEAPILGERYTALRGGGAFLNGDPIRVTDYAQEEGCRIITNEGMLTHPAWPGTMAGGGSGDAKTQCNAHSDVLGRSRKSRCGADLVAQIRLGPGSRHTVGRGGRWRRDNPSWRTICF